MDPRISFSNNFVDTHQTLKHENTYREAPVSADFEFSVNNNSMTTPADEVFFQGMLLPMRVHCSTRKNTLRDELLVNDDYEDVLPKVTRNSSWWKERLGLKRTVPKENNSSESVIQGLVEEKRHVYVQDSSSEKLEVFYEGGMSCRSSRNIVPLKE